MSDPRSKTASPITGANVEVTATFTRPLDEHTLAEVIAQTVLRTPGVVCLQPTLGTAGMQSLIRRPSTDGVQLLTRNGIVNADINIATTATHQARTVAEQVQTRTTAVIQASGCMPGTTTVSVLTIEAAPS